MPLEQFLQLLANFSTASGFLGLSIITFLYMQKDAERSRAASEHQAAMERRLDALVSALNQLAIILISDDADKRKQIAATMRELGNRQDDSN